MQLKTHTTASPTEQQTTEDATDAVPAEIAQICEFLSCNNKIVFKSQQIDDPDLQTNEKIAIAKDIYSKNRQTFLMRFGIYFQAQHLKNFKRLAVENDDAPLKPEEHGEEMQLLLKDFEQKLKTRAKDVKNRRYAALQQLVEEGEYFSELEMMKRAPELYQELVGQYLSEAEKKQRDSYDVRNTSFSDILMHTAQQQQMKDVLQQIDEKLQAEEITNDSCCQLEDSNDAQIANGTNTNDAEDDEYAIIPASYTQQWGNFDNEQQACSTSRATKHDKNTKSVINKKTTKKVNETKYITAGERELLRQEFIGVMHAEFLAGNDEDFDYTQIDDNAQLDDLQQLNQDKEDAYFEQSDDDDEVNDIIQANTTAEVNSESEDELDIYMSHLNRHFSLQK